MHFPSLATALALAPVVLAMPSAHVSRDLTQDLKWTGVIIPGQPETELFGSVGEILDQILAINPDYVAEPTSNSTEVTGVEPATHILQTRAEVRNCAVMATGNRGDTQTQINQLRQIGGSCTVNRGCVRMTCFATTGSYLCSETGGVVSILCSTAASHIQSIRDNCCQQRSVSGHIYSNNIYSVWAGYCNGNHPSTQGPSFYTYPGGSNNGVCPS